MREWLLKIVERIHIKLLPKEQIKISNSKIIPVVKCVAFKSGMNEDNVKRMLVRDMSVDLIKFIDFSYQTENNGVKILTARLDIVEKGE